MPQAPLPPWQDQRPGSGPMRLALLFLGAAIAGYGLARLAMALALPAPAPADLPGALPSAGQISGPVTVPAPDWPPLFGQPPEAEPAPEPRRAETAPPPAMRLRGLALDESGGWALIETEGRLLRLRPGEAVAEGYLLAEIGADFARVSGAAGDLSLGFDSSADLQPLRRSAAEAAARSASHPPPDLAPGFGRDFQFDFEPLPEGVISGPGPIFQGGL